MNELVIYFLKVNIAIAMFYLFYRLFFAGDTFWKTRRIYLLLSLFVSFSYPFLSIENWLQSQEPVQVFVANYAMLQEFIVTPTQETGISLETIIYLIYGFISFVLLSKMIVQLFSILRIRIQGKVQLIQNTRIIAVQKELTPFSFFSSIYLNPVLHNEAETKQILTHELTHVRQGHSYDVILSELLTIVCWINPASWLTKREIRQNLEFLADNKVLESGFDTKSYQYHLLQLAYQTPEIKLANKFNVSPLKKRITMMNQQKTSKAGILKYLLIVPLAAALVLSSNAENIISSVKSGLKENKNVQTQEKTLIKPTTKLDEIVEVGSGQAQVNQKEIKAVPPVPPVPGVKEVPSVPSVPEVKNSVYTVVEKMPQFPGGESELINYIGKNVKYPAQAQAKKIEGRIYVRFVVNKLGKVEKAEIIRSLDPECDKEALRVVNAMPQWTPGEQNGEKVSVYYTLPIVFSLYDFNSSSQGKNPIVGIEYGDKNYNNSGVAPKVKEFDPNYPPIFVIDGKIQSKDFNISTIKPETIERVDVIKPDTEAKKAELISKYGENAKFGVIIVTKKK